MRVGMTALTDSDTKKGLFLRRIGEIKKRRRHQECTSAVDYRSLMDTLVSWSLKALRSLCSVVCVHESGGMDSIQTHGLLPSYRRACPPLGRHIDAESFNANSFTTHTHSHRGSSKSQVRE